MHYTVQYYEADSIKAVFRSELKHSSLIRYRRNQFHYFEAANAF